MCTVLLSLRIASQATVLFLRSRGQVVLPSFPIARGEKGVMADSFSTAH